MGAGEEVVSANEDPSNFRNFEVGLQTFIEAFLTQSLIFNRRSKIEAQFRPYYGSNRLKINVYMKCESKLINHLHRCFYQGMFAIEEAITSYFHVKDMLRF